MVLKIRLEQFWMKDSCGETLLRPLTYITLDSIQEGVGQSQVLSYIKKLSTTNEIRLVTFEKIEPNQSLIYELRVHGVNWNYIPFGKSGIYGGVTRLFRLLQYIPSSGIVHARGDIAAFAAILRGSNQVIWDCRALMADHRRSLSPTNYQRIQAIFFSFIEKIIAKKSEKIIVITRAVIPVLKSRYALSEDKFYHISTCVDLSIFRPLREEKSKKALIRILIAGTLSPAYDISLMNQILGKLKKTNDVIVTVALGLNHDTSWKKLDYVDEVLSVTHPEMPQIINSSDFGFAIWRNDFGVALTSVAATKVAEFLACGVPVVVNSLQGDFGDLIPKHNVGISVLNSSEQEIERVVLEIRKLSLDSNLSERCRNFACDLYSLDKAIVILENLYKELE